MSAETYIEQVFPIFCKGRDQDGNAVLVEPVKVEVKVYQSSGVDTSISSVVRCEYNVGGHGHGCIAAYPRSEQTDEGAICPFAFDLPYALEKNNKRLDLY